MCVCMYVCFDRPYRADRQGTSPCRAHKSGQDKAGVQRQKAYMCVCVCVCVCVCDRYLPAGYCVAIPATDIPPGANSVTWLKLSS